MAGPMPHCASGKSAVTAAASRCAVLWRYRSSASGGVGSHEAHLDVGVEGVRQIDHVSVDHRRERLPGQAGRDPLRQLRGGGARGHRPRGSIRQRDGNLTHAVAVTSDRAAGAWKLVGTGGLEPPTSCMSSRRSNQLSYAASLRPQQKIIVHVAARRQPRRTRDPDARRSALQAGRPGTDKRAMTGTSRARPARGSCPRGERGRRRRLPPLRCSMHAGTGSASGPRGGARRRGREAAILCMRRRRFGRGGEAPARMGTGRPRTTVPAANRDTEDVRT